jgi:hypothetical protein
MIHRLDPLGKVIFASLTALFLSWVTALWFSSWRETATAAILVVGFQFLVGMIIGALARGKQAGSAVVICSVSFLWWPAWNGLLRQVEGLEFYMIFEVMPTMIGGFLALAIHKQISGHR